jgi:hypothetical protein
VGCGSTAILLTRPSIAPSWRSDGKTRQTQVLPCFSLLTQRGFGPEPAINPALFMAGLIGLAFRCFYYVPRAKLAEIRYVKMGILRVSRRAPVGYREHQCRTPSARRKSSACEPCKIASVENVPACEHVSAATVTDRGAEAPGHPVRASIMCP